MSVLRAIESRIEGLFEGVFGRAFRTHVQPVELARKLAKEMDEHRSVSVSRVYVPNEYTLYLSPPDREQFAAYEGSLVGELQEYLAEHARREGYALLTPPRVSSCDADLAVGEFGIATRVVAARGPAPARRPTPPRRCRRRGPRRAEPAARPGRREPAANATRDDDLPARDAGQTTRGGRRRQSRRVVTLTLDGRGVPVASAANVIGRSRECDVRLDDGNVSRRHCEVAQESRPPGRRRPRLDERDGGQRPPGHAPSARRRRHDHRRGTELVFGRPVREPRRHDRRGAARAQARLSRPPLPRSSGSWSARRPARSSRHPQESIVLPATRRRAPRAVAPAARTPVVRRKPGARTRKRRRGSTSATLVGRGAENAIRLEADTTVSNRHAVLEHPHRRHLGRGLGLDQRHVRQRRPRHERAAAAARRRRPDRPHRPGRGGLSVASDAASGSRTPAAGGGRTRTPMSASRRSSRSRTGWAARRPASSPRGSPRPRSRSPGHAEGGEEVVADSSGRQTPGSSRAR